MVHCRCQLEIEVYKKKGNAGEREFCEWFQNQLNLDVAPKRNLEQTRDGGADVIYPPFIFEVKRCETLSFQAWWEQICAARDKWRIENDRLLTPAVAYRQNRGQWEFLIAATEIGSTMGGGYIWINRFVFVRWVELVMKNDH